MLNKSLPTQIREYFECKSCLCKYREDRDQFARGLAALKHMRDRIFDQLDNDSALVQEPLFAQVRQYLLDEMKLDEGGLCQANRDVAARRLDGVMQALHKKLLQIDEGEPKKRPAARRPSPRVSHKEPRHSEKAPVRILIAVDESEQSKWAVQAGGRLAGERAASIILVHVVPFPTLPGVSTMGSHDGNQVLEAAREPLPQSLEITELLRSGDPPDEILAAAHEWHADLIIMGTHGRGRLAAFLLGSTADSVIRRARCPVLTIAHQPASEFWGEPIQTESTRQPSLTVASA